MSNSASEADRSTTLSVTEQSTTVEREFYIEIAGNLIGYHPVKRKPCKCGGIGSGCRCEWE